MVKGQALALSCLAGLAAAAPAADVSSLVQKDARLHAGSAEGAGDHCDCFSWPFAYRHGAICGSGHELDLIHGVPGPEAAKIGQMKFEFCEMLFGSLPDDFRFCINNDFVGSPTQWCYVNPMCKRSAPAQGGTLNVKNCTAGQDKSLGDLKFEEFAAYAHKSKLELGLLVQYAYPRWEGEKLPDVQAFWGLPAPKDAAPISEALKARLQAQVSSGKPVFLSSRSGHPPFAVAEGEKLYYINFAPKTAIDFKHKEDMNAWGCVAGCGSDNKPLW
uniref:Phospholipase B-like n=1 Tax=Alexandrium catenella TaxID=2925 RepID=A0A7S1KW17_ALECA|mmetsp:Transcript_101782/g.270799  ORF Transcript_101782/g.270799 Transcript_101782/m.270799 type:complete len:273 (+) Transcript_101782:61-879(+)